MEKQPEALRLADCLERDCEMNWPDYDNQINAAAELRRLYAEVDRLSYRLAYPDNFVSRAEEAFDFAKERGWVGLTDEEINEVARYQDEHGSGPWYLSFARAIEKEVKRGASFDRAELWLGRINKAVEEEREACAKVCEDIPHYMADDNEYIASAIRARRNI